MSVGARGSEAGRPPTRRDVVAGGLALALAGPSVAAAPALRFGLTPVFLSNDLALLESLRGYLEAATGRGVQLVTRRTYQEITALLVSGRLDAAWICGYPFVQYRDRLDLVAVPVWRGATLYRSCLICGAERHALGIDDLAGDLHAFSDPDSNSGFLVTQALLAARGLDAERFFRRAIFTYGHRNVVRAVGAGLAQSGSLDGYVLDVLSEIEPALADRVRVIRRSEPLGFPPVAAPVQLRASAAVGAIRAALLGMAADARGRGVLAALRLDGFAERDPALYDAIAGKWALVRSLG